MTTLLNEILFTVETKYIPPIDSKSRAVFDLLVDGVKRKFLASINESYRGSPLEDIESDKYGNWLIDRYKDSDGDSSLRFNYRHLSGDRDVDAEARRIRRKERSEFSLKLAKQGKKRIPKAEVDVSAALRAYFMDLGEAANEPSSESKKPTKD
jgi:hypothetical protein